MLIDLQTIETDEDKSKFEAIYREYRGLMYAVAYRRLRHEQDAEDVVHHVFAKIAEHIGAVEPVGLRTKQLVVTMVDNRATDLLRARGRHPPVPYDDALWDRACAQPEGEDLLSECILKLPGRQRMVLWLKYVQGYDLREIAKMLDISLSCARKLDQRAKARLAQLYREGGGAL